jgi:hypothetical protein
VLPRVAATAVCALALAFVCLIVAAMALYPGGTWEEPHTHGVSVIGNYFCDLMRPSALNGEPNPGAPLASLALLALAGALIPFFMIAPRTFSQRPRLGPFVRGSGLIAGIAGVGVVIAPSYRLGSLVHGLVILAAAGPGLAAVVGATVGQLRGDDAARRAGFVAVGVLLFTALATAVFARQLSIGTESTPGLAALQKLAALAAVSWLAATSVLVWRR